MSDINPGFEPPPPPPYAEAPTGEDMSTAATMTGIFFEPGRVFDALRVRPRFLTATVILTILTIAITAALYMRIDMGQYIREKMEKGRNAAQQTEAQKEMGVKIGKIIGAVLVPASVPITLFAGAGLYMLGVAAFGGAITYKKSLAVWAYSSLPPAVLASIVALLVLFLKSAETIDPEHLLVTNPGAFMSADSSPVVVALLSQFDLLRFYGLFLAALGLRKVAKMSSGGAWGVVIAFFLIGAVLKIASSAIFGG